MPLAAKLKSPRRGNEKVCTLIPGWAEAARKYGAKASMKDLREIKVSLQELLTEDGFCCEDPVHETAWNGHLELMKFLICTSYDMNSGASTECNETAFHTACQSGKTEMARLMIESSKEFDIDLDARNDYERFPLGL